MKFFSKCFPVASIHRLALMLAVAIYSFTAISLSNVNAKETSTDKYELETENYHYVLSSLIHPLAINTMHQWQLHIESLSGDIVENAVIKVDGGMPMHNHGLPTAPKATEYLGDGNYVIDGVKFHMAGQWQLRFVIVVDGHEDKLSFDIEL